MQNLMCIALFILTLVLYSEAVCCGRGRHGFCNDCSKVYGIWSYGQKCCGSSSTSGMGCNWFCCNCRSCKTGHPRITHHYGRASHKVACKQSPSAGDSHFDGIFETLMAFESLDKDDDNSLDQKEFLEGSRSHFNVDLESSFDMAVDLVNDGDNERPINLLDAEENGNDEVFDILRRASAEFNKMDSNKDGIIQANEFDKDLA